MISHCSFGQKRQIPVYCSIAVAVALLLGMDPQRLCASPSVKEDVGNAIVGLLVLASASSLPKPGVDDFFLTSVINEESVYSPPNQIYSWIQIINFNKE